MSPQPGPRLRSSTGPLRERVFGTQNPIGQLVTGGGVTYQVIGVAGNIKSRTIGEDTRATLFRSIDQSVASDPSVMGYTLIVSTRGDPAALTPSVREAVRALDPTMAVFNVATMQEHVKDALFLPRLAGTLFGIFGGIGLMLATVGLYGVISYSVSRRTREIGIRMALGAQVGAVQRLIVGQGMLLTLIALALGLPGAWIGGKIGQQLPVWGESARLGDLRCRTGHPWCGRSSSLLDSRAAGGAGRSADCASLRVGI